MKKDCNIWTCIPFTAIDREEIYKLINNLSRVHQTHFHFAKVLQETIIKESPKIIQDLTFYINRVINQWNSLPQFVISSNNLNRFKSNLDNYWKETWYGQSKGHWPIKFYLSLYNCDFVLVLVGNEDI